MVLAHIEPDFTQTLGSLHKDSCQATTPRLIFVELVVIKITFTFSFIIKKQHTIIGGHLENAVS